MSGGETPGLLITFSNLLYVHISTRAIVAFVDCTHVGPSIASVKDLVTVAQENSTNQTRVHLPLD